jgi:hypothetical protein
MAEDPNAAGNDPIETYIRANANRFTREAIRSRLVEAGYPEGDIDLVWDRIRQQNASNNLVSWAKALYVLGLLVMGVGACSYFGFFSYYETVGGAGALTVVPGLVGFAILGWLVVVLTRRTASGARLDGLRGFAGFMGVLIAMILVFGGSCLASIGLWS